MIRKITIILTMVVCIAFLAGVGTATEDATVNNTVNSTNTTVNTTVVNTTVNTTVDPFKNFTEQVKFIRNVSDESFCHDSWGRKYIINDGDFYYPNETAFDAYASYSGSDGDIYEDVLVVAQTNNMKRVFNKTSGTELMPQNNLPWRFSVGNYRLLEPHWTTMPSGGSKEEIDPAGIPDELVISDSASKNFGLMQEIWASHPSGSTVIKVVKKGEWNADTVKQLREQYPDKTVIILEWHEEEQPVD